MNFRLFELRGFFLLSSIFLWSHICVAQSAPPLVSAVLGENNLSFSTSFNGSDVFFVEIDHPGGFFQVDNIGSNFSTEFGLYNAFGELIDTNDGFGNDGLSSTVGAVGGLPAGTYFVGAAAVLSSFFNDFVVTSNNTFVSEANLVVNYTNPNQAPPVANVSGTITLPVEFIPNNNDVVVEIGLFGTDGSGGSPSFRFVPNLASESVSIAAGENSVNYELDYILFDDLNEIAISFRCIGNCEEVDAGFFLTFNLQDDGTFSTASNAVPLNTVPLGQFPDTVDFQFPAPPELETVSGTVSLPRGVILDDDAVVEISLFEFDAEAANSSNFLGATGFIINSVFSSVMIEAGNSSADYELVYIRPASDSELSIFFSCGSNSCFPVIDGFLNTFILQDDGTFDDGLFRENVFNTIPVADFSNTIDFQFPSEAPVISPIFLLLLGED